MSLRTTFLCILILIISACQPENKTESTSFDKEKKAILQSIENETKAAFSRDYEAWKTNWVHHPYVSKTYMNFVDSTFSETLGWQAINDFVQTYIEEHPEPAPPPQLPKNVEIRLFGEGAWVSYTIVDDLFGLKRETRLMEKEDDIWKIAGLNTTIYGSTQSK